MFSDASERFYPIIDTEVCGRRGMDPRAVACACLAGGARVLQLRMKTGATAALLAIADDLVSVSHRSEAALIVNDRVDVAVMAGARGVHVGQEDLPPEAVRRISASLVVGLSTHDEAQVDRALTSGADYIAVGPIFGTATKATGYSARGLSLVRYAARRGKPVVAIGGITLDNARSVIDAGAAAVAVISDLFASGSVEDRARAFGAALAGAG